MPDEQMLNEQRVLGMVLWDATETGGRETADEFARLIVDDFEASQHQAIFRAMISVSGHQAATVDVVTDRLRVMQLLDRAGGAVYVTALLHGIFGSAQFGFYAHRLRVATVRRQSLAMLHALTDAAVLPEPDLCARLRFVSQASSLMLERLNG